MPLDQYGAVRGRGSDFATHTLLTFMVRCEGLCKLQGPAHPEPPGQALLPHSGQRDGPGARGCDSTHTLLTFMARSRAMRRSFCVIFVDPASAFDRGIREIVLGVPPGVCDLRTYLATLGLDERRATFVLQFAARHHPLFESWGVPKLGWAACARLRAALRARRQYWCLAARTWRLANLLHCAARPLIAEDRRRYLWRLAANAQRLGNAGDQHGVYEVARFLAGRFRRRVSGPTLLADGSRTDTEATRQARWQQHFAGVLAAEVVDRPAAGRGTPAPVTLYLEGLCSAEHAFEATAALPACKGPGPDGIQA